MKKEIYYTKKGKYKYEIDIQDQNNVDIFLDAENIDIEIIGKGEIENQKISAKISVHHRVPKTQSKIILRSVLRKKAQLDVRGLIHINKKASGSKSSFSHKTLMLSEESHVKTEPNLEIQNNDVEVSHDATITEVSKKDIYYLQTRGLTRKQAQKEIIKGFLNL